MDNYKIIGVNGNEIFTNILLHPVEVLKEELEARGIDMRQFAEAIGLQTPYLNEIFKGKKSISPELALKIEETLKINANFWIRLQIKFDLDKAGKQQGYK